MFNIYKEDFNFDEIITKLNTLEVGLGEITKQINNKEIDGNKYYLQMSIVEDYLPYTNDILSFIV